MADDNYAIKVSFEGIDKAIADVKSLQTVISNIKAPILNIDLSKFAGIEKTQIASAAKVEAAQIASQAKIETARITGASKVSALEVSAIAKLESAQLAANAKVLAAKDGNATKAITAEIAAQTRLESIKIASATKISNAEISTIAKLEAARIASATKVSAVEASTIAKLEAAQIAANSKLESARIASSTKLDLAEKARLANAAKASQTSAQKEAQTAANLIAQLEKQKATSNVRASDGGDKEAARIALETLRYKQQIAAIDAKIFNPADIANAKALATEINKLNLAKIKKGFDDASPVTFNQFIGATTEKARDLAEQLQNTSNTLERIGTSFNKVTGAAQEAFLGFDSARVKVGSLSKDSQGLANQSKALVNELGNQATSTQVLAANYQILSSGFTKSADVTDITKASLIGATAGFTDTATVADALTSVLNAYGKQASEAGKIVDQFIVTQDRGKTTVAEFAQNLGNVIPISAAAGVSFEEVQGALAALTLQGVKSDTAITNIKNVIQDIVAPSDKAKKAFEGIGIANGAATLKAEGLIGVLTRLKDAGVDSADEIAKFFGDIRSQSGVSGLLKGDLASFKEITQDITVRGGKALQDYQSIAQSAQGRVTAAFNKINEALVNLGSGAAVAFAPLLSAVSGLIDVFNGLPAPIQGAVGVAIALTGAIATLGAVITAAGAAAPAFVGGLKLFTGAAGASAIASGVLASATNAVTVANTLLTTKLTASAIATGATTLATTAATAATGAFAVATNVATVAVGALLSPLGLAALAVGALVVGAKPLADAFNVSEASKSVADLNQKLAELKAKRGEVATPKAVSKDDGLGQNQGSFVNPFNTRLSEQKEIISFSENQKRYNEILDESKNTLATYGLTSADAGDKARLGAKGIEDFTKKATEQKEEIDLVIASLQQQSANAKTNPALQAQLNNEVVIFTKRKKLLDDRIAFLKDSTKAETSAIEAVTDAQRKQAAVIKENQNQDSERNIKRGFDDKKATQDRENAKAIAAIEEQNSAKKANLDRKQALETESLKERQALALQDKQRAFDAEQDAKRIASEQALENKKAAFDDKQRQRQQSFEDAQAKLKEDRAEKLRKEDEAFAAQRAARDQQNEAALSGAKSLLSNEGKVATADPAERDKIAQQVAEETRIKSQAANVATGGTQTQEQLVAQAKQLAQVSAIATQEEQAKVLLALDAIESANKAKQAELDKAEDAKRTAERQASDKAFELSLLNEKRAFDAQLKTESVNFEQTVIKPEKQKIDAELNAQKLAFERGELAALKRTQAAEERALQLKQTTEDIALQKSATAELDALKLAQKQKEIALDRAFEDQKIERERAFKESQRALDKASAIEIQAILGKSAQQIINAIAVTKGGNVLSSAVGVKGVETQATKIPAFANGGVSKGGIALVGEKGAELVTMPKGANVIPNNKTSALLSGSKDDGSEQSDAIDRLKDFNDKFQFNIAVLEQSFAKFGATVMDFSNSLQAKDSEPQKSINNVATNFPKQVSSDLNTEGFNILKSLASESVSLPRGSNVLPAPQTKSLINNNSGGNKTYNINVTTAATNSMEVASQVQRELARAAAVGF